MAELIYTLDQARSEQDSALTIKIQLAERDGFILKPLKAPATLTRERLQQLMTPKDATLIPFLIKEEQAFVKKHIGRILGDKDSFEFIHIPYNMTSQALKLFATTGKLYFNDKPLVIDLFGKTEYYYTVDTSSGKPLAKGHLKTASQDFALVECDYIGRGPPHWFIKGMSLKFITSEVPWKDLKSTFEANSPNLQQLINDAKEDSDAPRVVVDSAIAISQPEPLPILVLKDRLGAFADLWMNYGEGSTLVAYHSPSNSVEKDGKPFCKRQPTTELSWEKDLLETDYIKKTVDSSHYYCPLDKVAKSIAFLLEIGWQVRDARNHLVVQHHHTELCAKADTNTIAIKGKLHYGDFQADLNTIVGAFNRRERFAEIAPGHVALLPNSLEQVGLEGLAEEGEIIGENIYLKRNQLGALANLFETHPQLGLDQAMVDLKDKLNGFQGIATVSPGIDFCGTLRPYQQIGLNWLSFLHEYHFHGLLADDMGLGKTVQVLAFLSRLKLHTPVLIIVPTSLIFNWKKEIERFLPNSKVFVYHGPKRQSTIETLAQPHIIITTYTTARLDIDTLKQLTYACLILDEAQAIKNAATQTFQTVARLHSDFRLSITGTPVENNISELWAHFRFLIPDLFEDEASFNAEVQAGMSDPRFLRRIKKKIKPFLLRRRKEEVAKDLPEKIEQTVWIEMQPEQRTVYEEFLSGVRRNLIAKVGADGVSKHRMEILEAIMRLRQICCHPQLVTSHERAAPVESAKLEALMQDLETAISEKRKVLVYSQFTSMLALIRQQLQKQNWNYVYLDGSTQNREKVVTQFQEDPAIPIFLISLKAGGIGLNLTAADYVFLYDPWWNAAAENQAIDRAHRIGRKETVIAKRYIMAESIEEKMMKLKEAKSSFASDILDDGQIASALSLDDLMFLLN